MIAAGLEFSTATRRAVLQALLSLPTNLAPTRVVENEGDIGDPIGDPARFVAAADERGASLSLEGPAGSFDISVTVTRPIEVRCFLKIEPRDAKTFMVAMASAQPLFGYACAYEELKKRNRVLVPLGIETVEAWVGFDTQRYIPGLYWLTLLPRAVADRHRVPLPGLAAAALEHVALDATSISFAFTTSPRTGGGWTIPRPTSRAPAPACSTSDRSRQRLKPRPASPPSTPCWTRGRRVRRRPRALGPQ